MRVLIEDYVIGPSYDGSWRPKGDYLVLAETDKHYKVERFKKIGWIFKKEVRGTQWFPKEGIFTRCTPIKLKGWWVCG